MKKVTLLRQSDCEQLTLAFCFLEDLGGGGLQCVWRSGTIRPNLRALVNPDHGSCLFLNCEMQLTP